MSELINENKLGVAKSTPVKEALKIFSNFFEAKKMVD